jgi:hypothetical protein
MIKSSFRAGVLAPLVASFGLALVAAPAEALEPQFVKPILRSVDNPDQITSGLSEDVTYSFGYAFNVDQDNYFTTALGLGFQNDWLGGANSTPYNVGLWSVLFEHGNDDPTLDLLASVVFDPTNSSLSSSLLDSAIGGSNATTRGLNYWLSVPKVTLAKSSGNNDFYYVVGVSGRFAGDGAILPSVFGTPSFADDVISYVFEGFNASDESSYSGTTGFGFPAPIFAFNPDGDEDGGPFAAQGFWNANVALDVPGPLPLMGVGAAFGWSRRLKRKTSSLRKP